MIIKKHILNKNQRLRVDILVQYYNMINDIHFPKLK